MAAAFLCLACLIPLGVSRSSGAAPSPTTTHVRGQQRAAPHLWYHGVTGMLDLRIGSKVALKPQIIHPHALSGSEHACVWAASQLPAGLDICNRTGLISGTPWELTPAIAVAIFAHCWKVGLSCRAAVDLEEDSEPGEVGWIAQASLQINVGYGTAFTMAGTGLALLTSMAGGYGQEQHLWEPRGLCAHQGKLYIGQVASIALLDLKTGYLGVFLGRPGMIGSKGDGLPKHHALVGTVAGLVVVEEELFFTDFTHHVVRKVGLPTLDPSGVVERVAGNGVAAKSQDGTKATNAMLSWPWGLEASEDGSVLYISSTNANKIVAVNLSTGTMTTLAGTGAWDYSGDGGDARRATLAWPRDLLLVDGALYIADESNRRVRWIDLHQSPHIIHTMAGGGKRTSDGAPAAQWRIDNPWGLAVGPDSLLYIATNGSVLVADLKTRGHRMARIMGRGVSRLAIENFDSSNKSHVSGASGVAVHGGRLYVSDFNSHKVRSAPALGLASSDQEDILKAWEEDQEALKGAQALAMAMHIHLDPWQSSYSGTQLGGVNLLPVAAQHYVSPALPVKGVTTAISKSKKATENRSQHRIAVRFAVTVFLGGHSSQEPQAEQIVVGIATEASVQSLQAIPQRDVQELRRQRDEGEVGPLAAFIGSAFVVELRDHTTKEYSISLYMSDRSSSSQGQQGKVKIILDGATTIAGEVHGVNTGSGYVYKIEKLSINEAPLNLSLARTPTIATDVPLSVFVASLDGAKVHIPAQQPPIMSVIHR